MTTALVALLRAHATLGDLIDIERDTGERPAPLTRRSTTLEKRRDKRCAGIKTGLELGMRETYTEGVATHGGPEPCASARKDRGEALDRGRCRLGY